MFVLISCPVLARRDLVARTCRDVVSSSFNVAKGRCENLFRAKASWWSCCSHPYAPALLGRGARHNRENTVCIGKKHIADNPDTFAVDAASLFSTSQIQRRWMRAARSGGLVLSLVSWRPELSAARRNGPGYNRVGKRGGQWRQSCARYRADDGPSGRRQDSIVPAHRLKVDSATLQDYVAVEAMRSFCRQRWVIDIGPGAKEE